MSLICSTGTNKILGRGPCTVFWTVLRHSGCRKDLLNNFGPAPISINTVSAMVPAVSQNSLPASSIALFLKQDDLISIVNQSFFDFYKSPLQRNSNYIQCIDVRIFLKPWYFAFHFIGSNFTRKSKDHLSCIRNNIRMVLFIEICRPFRSSVKNFGWPCPSLLPVFSSLALSEIKNFFGRIEDGGLECILHAQPSARRQAGRFVVRLVRVSAALYRNRGFWTCCPAKGIWDNINGHCCSLSLGDFSIISAGGASSISSQGKYLTCGSLTRCFKRSTAHGSLLQLWAKSRVFLCTVYRIGSSFLWLPTFFV